MLTLKILRHQASLYGDANIVKILLAHGAHLEPKTGPTIPSSFVEAPVNNPLTCIDYGDAPASGAFRRNITAKALTQYLIQKKVHLEGREVDLKPFGEAREFCHCSVLRLLLYGGYHAELNSATGWTPLHEAAWGGHEAIIWLLVSREC